MNGAEFKTLRQSLRLSIEWVANAMGVRQRSVYYWESGRSKVPDDVRELLQRIDAHIDARVKRYMRAVSGSGAALIERYRGGSELWTPGDGLPDLPSSTHSAMVMRVTRELTQRGIPLRIEYLKDEG